jgi:hypothetical protein
VRSIWQRTRQTFLEEATLGVAACQREGSLEVLAGRAAAATAELELSEGGRIKRVVGEALGVRDFAERSQP